MLSCLMLASAASEKARNISGTAAFRSASIAASARAADQAAKAGVTVTDGSL